LVLTRLATLIGLALPAAGAFSRFLSHRLDGEIPVQLAAAATLPELAVFGQNEVFPQRLVPCWPVG